MVRAVLHIGGAFCKVAVPHGTDRAGKIASRRRSYDKEFVWVDAVFLRVFAYVDDRRGHVGERAREERFRLSDRVIQDKCVEALRHEADRKRIALMRGKRIESSARQYEHRGTASGEDVRGQRHVGTHGIEDDGFGFHRVRSFRLKMHGLTSAHRDFTS